MAYSKYYSTFVPLSFHADLIQHYLPEYPAGAVRNIHTVICRAKHKEQANEIARRVFGWDGTLFQRGRTEIKTESNITQQSDYLSSFEPYKLEKYRLPFDACRQHGIVIQLCQTGLFYSLEKILKEDDELTRIIEESQGTTIIS